MSRPLDRLTAIMSELVRRDGRDLSGRQLAIFAIAYSTDVPQTVRGLAATLSIAKPAVTRALNRLEEIGLAMRKPDFADRRSIFVGRTLEGIQFAKDLDRIVKRAEFVAPAKVAA